MAEFQVLNSSVLSDGNPKDLSWYSEFNFNFVLCVKRTQALSFTVLRATLKWFWVVSCFHQVADSSWSFFWSMEAGRCLRIKGVPRLRVSQDQGCLRFEGVPGSMVSHDRGHPRFEGVPGSGLWAGSSVCWWLYRPGRATGWGYGSMNKGKSVPETLPYSVSCTNQQRVQPVGLGNHNRGSH